MNRRVPLVYMLALIIGCLVTAIGLAQVAKKNDKKKEAPRIIAVCKDGTLLGFNNSEPCLGNDILLSVQTVYANYTNMQHQIEVLSLQNELMTKELLAIRKK